MISDILSYQQFRLRQFRLAPLQLIAASLVIASVLIAFLSGSAPDGDPGIVARVNGDAILRSELIRAKADLLEAFSIQGIDREQADVDELEALALQMLIRRQLMLQEAERRNFTVGDDELDSAIAELRRRFPDLSTFGAWMQERRLNDRSLIGTIEDDILVRQVSSALVAPVSLTEEQYADYFAKHANGIQVGEEVRLGIIAVDSEAGSEEILDKLRSGRLFNRLARERSLLPDTYTDWVDPQELPAPLQAAIHDLNEGDVYGPVQKSADEYLVVGMAGRRPVMATDLDEARAGIRERLMPELQQKTLSNWLVARERQSNVETFLDF